MRRSSAILALLCCLICVADGSAEEALAKGKLLVASLELRGPIFAQTVILLLHYDETGAVGLIVNRPMNVAASELSPEHGDLARYGDALYLGGPVEIFTLRSLLRSDTPPSGAGHIFDTVYLAPIDAAGPELPPDASRQRFFLGYAGWAPRQLEDEIARGSWHIRPATAELVFADDSSAIWRELVPPGREFRAGVDTERLAAALR